MRSASTKIWPPVRALGLLVIVCISSISPCLARHSRLALQGPPLFKKIVPKFRTIHVFGGTGTHGQTHPNGRQVHRALVSRPGFTLSRLLFLPVKHADMNIASD